MKTIMVISPQYLSAVYKEAMKYSFVIQGYGNFKAASEGLLKVNSIDLLGIAYLGYDLPEPGTEEYVDLCEFLQRCELFEDSKVVVFITQSANVLRSASRGITHSEILLLEDESDVTDLVINQDLFGTILQKVRTPYKMKKEEDGGNVLAVSVKEDSWQLKYDSIFNDDLRRCLQKVELLETVEDTMGCDRPLSEFTAEQKTVFALARKIMILKSCKKRDIVLESELSRELMKLEDALVWCVLKAVLEG